MNARRRDRLETAAALIRRAAEIIDGVRSEEADALDNVPENLQTGDNYEKMESAVDRLDDALSSLSDAADSLEDAAV